MNQFLLFLRTNFTEAKKKNMDLSCNQEHKESCWPRIPTGTQCGQAVGTLLLPRKGTRLARAESNHSPASAAVVLLPCSVLCWVAAGRALKCHKLQLSPSHGVL